MNKMGTYLGWKRSQPSEMQEMIRSTSKEMESLIQSTLGPFGLDKMIVRRMPDDELRSFVSNDGVAILEEFEGETDHPISQHFIKLAEEQEEDSGDGVTTMVLLASELLDEAMELADKGIHPIDIIEGFSIGAQRTLELWEESATALVNEDGELERDKLVTIAMNGMTNGRTESWPLADVAEMVVDGVLHVSDPQTGTVRLDHAKTIAVPGGKVTDSKLIDGVIIPKSVVTGDHLLPTTGAVLLIRGDLTSRDLSRDVNITIEDQNGVNQLTECLNDSAEIATNIDSSDAVAVVATGDVDPAIATELSKYGIVAIRNVKDTDFEYVMRATGATPRGPILPNTHIDPDILGSATARFFDAGREDDWLAFRPRTCAEMPAVTFLARGGTQSVAEEAERRIKSGKNILRACIKKPSTLPAGGAADIAAANEVRLLAIQFDGREQLAIDAFADVLESIPKTLARNAGLDPLKALAELRARHDAGHPRAAISKYGTVVDDVANDGDGHDSFQIRVTGLVRAVEFVSSIIRIDNILVDE